MTDPGKYFRKGITLKEILKAGIILTAEVKGEDQSSNDLVRLFLRTPIP